MSVPTGAENVATALHKPEAVATVRLEGQVSTGKSVSTTVTVEEQVAVSPDASVTWNTFVVVPMGNVDPLARPLVRLVVDAQLSVPTGVG